MNDLIIMFKINQTQCHVWMIGCSLHVLFSEKTLFSNCIIQPIIIFSYHHRLLLVIRNKIRFMMHIWQQTINYNYLVLQGFPFCIILPSQTLLFDTAIQGYISFYVLWFDNYGNNYHLQCCQENTIYHAHIPQRNILVHLFQKYILLISDLSYCMNP